ncbi:BPSL1445 family SYLF domain-containing lipoprotein [Cupriavidus basilensis]|uniref:BPSL1445 family SYLF domain-containing lipoprotein n=3 Tax=Cupriavidus TaxID=106589 RepID=UPI000751249B|nr:YSC84-related protein [Cupriavidus basilensis]
MNRRQFVTRMAGSGLLVATAFTAGCTTTGTNAPTDAAAKRQEINAGADGALNRLYGTTSSARELAARAQGILVFPRVLSAGLVIGGEYGEGVLRGRSGAPVGYYRTTSASVGLTAGGQSKSVIIMFMTPDAYSKFLNSSGWTVGADASVALAKIGANGSIDTNTAQQPVIGFVQTNAGLMFDISLDGSKIGKLDL